MSLLSFAHWLEQRDWAMDFAGSAYFYPIVLATHLTCIGIFGGMILITNLRLLGWVLRSVGGTLGGQLSGSILAGQVLAGGTLPTWSAFTTAIWIDAAVAVLAVAGGIALRRARRPATAVEPGLHPRQA